MALKASVCKVQLQVSDIDRGYYAGHALTLAQHPSETVERLMVRLLAFALYADEALRFGRGVSSEDEPDLWQHSLDGRIERWIELGQPDEARLRRAAGRSDSLVVIGYAPRSFMPWWEKNADGLARLDKLDVWCLPPGATESLVPFHARNMTIDCVIQEGEVQLTDGERSVIVVPQRMR